MAVVVEERVCGLRPFQDDIRSVEAVKGEETAVEPLALPLQHAYGDLDAGLTDALDATSLHLRKRVYTAHHHTLHAFPDNQIATGRSLAIVGTGLQTHIDSSLCKQMLVFLAY